jgi:hypothetical protein
LPRLSGEHETAERLPPILPENPAIKNGGLSTRK